MEYENKDEKPETMAAITHRDGVVVGEGEATGDEVLLGLGTLVHDLKDAGLELGDDGDVVGRNAVLSGGTGDDHLGDLGLAVDGLVGEAEVEGHGAVAGLGGSGGHAPGDPAGDGGEGSSEGEHGGFQKTGRQWDELGDPAIGGTSDPARFNGL